MRPRPKVKMMSKNRQVAEVESYKNRKNSRAKQLGAPTYSRNKRTAVKCCDDVGCGPCVEDTKKLTEDWEGTRLDYELQFVAQSLLTLFFFHCGCALETKSEKAQKCGDKAERRQSYAPKSTAKGMCRGCEVAFSVLSDLTVERRESSSSQTISNSQQPIDIVCVIISS